MSRRDTAFGPTNGAVIIHLYHIIFRQVQQGHRLEKKSAIFVENGGAKSSTQFLCRRRLFLRWGAYNWAERERVAKRFHTDIREFRVRRGFRANGSSSSRRKKL